MALLLVGVSIAAARGSEMKRCDKVFCVAPGYRAEVGLDIPHSAWHGATGVLFKGTLVAIRDDGGKMVLPPVAFYRGAIDGAHRFCLVDEIHPALDESGNFSQILWVPEAHAFPALGVPQDCVQETAVLIRADGCADLVVDVSGKWEARELRLQCSPK